MYTEQTYITSNKTTKPSCLSMCKFTILSSYHNEWVNIVRSFGECNYPEDVVQDMYLKVVDYGYLDRIFDEEKLNKGYVWVMLRTMYLDTKKNKCTQSIGTYDVAQDEVSPEYERAFEELTYNMYKALMELDDPDKYPYKKELFKQYALSDMSYQDIEDEIGITKRSAWYTCDKVKREMIAKIGEDYIDLLNGDYERI